MLDRYMRIFFVLAVSLLLFSSCRVLIPHEMFKTDKNTVFYKDTSAVMRKDYHITIGDRIEMNFYTIEGFHLVDITGTSATGTGGSINYLVEEDGQVKLPILGK